MYDSEYFGNLAYYFYIFTFFLFNFKLPRQIPAVLLYVVSYSDVVSCERIIGSGVIDHCHRHRHLSLFSSCTSWLSSHSHVY